MKREDVKREDVRRGGRRGPLGVGGWVLLLTFHVFAFQLLPARAYGEPTQEEVFRSIGENVDQPVDSKRLAAAVAGIGGVIVLLVVVGQWRGREGRPKGLNHHGKLMKEVLRNVPLKGAEVKQIRLLAENLRPHGRDERVESPLTLLLCPSLLGEAAKQSRGKADLPVVAGLVKRLVGRG